MSQTDITFITKDGERVAAVAGAEATLMDLARTAGIDGIMADCGGSCSCATCHVYVDPAFADRLPAPEAAELEMLEGVAAERRPTSRLSCQVKIAPELSGMTVEIPPFQL